MDTKFKSILLICLIFGSSYVYGDNSVSCKNEVRCRISRTHGMKAADCYDRQFRTFPKCIPYDVEVIELSFNRIRKVSKSDLSKFKYLKFLYLTDNLISNLDDDAFKDLDSLNTLDLSLNAITKVPTTIFQLPSLKTLYLSQNLNINIIDVIEQAKPVTSPLMLMDISFTTDEDNVFEFPDFGFLPFIATLNITANQYLNIAPRHFAGLCSLEFLINVNVTTAFNDDCDCWLINRWLKERGVTFVPFVCPVEEIKCSHVELNDEDKSEYSLCGEFYEELERGYRIWKISIASGIVVPLLVIAICVYFCCVRKKQRNQEKEENRKNDSILEPEGKILLNNQKPMPK